MQVAVREWKESHCEVFLTLSHRQSNGGGVFPSVEKACETAMKGFPGILDL